MRRVRPERDRTAAQGLLVLAHGHAGNAARCGHAPTMLQRRSRVCQGPKPQSGFLKELVWDWLVDMRASVAGRLPDRSVLFKARELAADACSWSLRSASSLDVAAVAPLESALRCRVAQPQPRVRV